MILSVCGTATFKNTKGEEIKMPVITGIAGSAVELIAKAILAQAEEDRKGTDFKLIKVSKITLELFPPDKDVRPEFFQEPAAV